MMRFSSMQQRRLRSTLICGVAVLNDTVEFRTRSSPGIGQPRPFVDVDSMESEVKLLLVFSDRRLGAGQDSVNCLVLIEPILGDPLVGVESKRNCLYIYTECGKVFLL